MNISKALYRKRGKYQEKEREIYGLDTETDIEGNIFLLCDSSGNFISGSNFDDYFNFLIQKNHEGKIAYFYNMRFDLDSIFNLASPKIKEGLTKVEWFEYGNYHILNIDYKGLKIQQGHHYFNFFDISNFFPYPSLNQNCKEFLGLEKIEIGDKEFTQERIIKDFFKIKDYCVQDCILTKKLGEYVQNRTKKLGFCHYPEYSIASYSKKLFSNYTSIPYLRNIPKPVIKEAYKTYRGGRFELLQKGNFEHVWEYDLNSAYSHAIENLENLKGEWIEIVNRDSLKDCSYAFLDCKIEIKNPFVSPLGFKYIDYCYPSFSENHYPLTLSEFDILDKYGYDVKINKGYGFIPHTYFKPFKRFVTNLLERRKEYKEKQDFFMDFFIKKIINSFYGLQIQRYKQNGEIVTGSLFNPVYASVITSDIKTNLLDLIYSRHLEEDLISINTDSIHLTKNLGLLEGFKKETNGERGRYLMSGIYSVEGKKNRKRCFEIPIDFFKESDFNLDSNIKEVGNTRPCHLKESLHRPILKVGKFEYFPKQISLENGINREWKGELKNWNDFFNHSIQSETLRIV